ncbi:MAG: hypothetical protein A2666_02450 [Parcubacteria group bacterium RIFCSPHIGHO2_01_FULL_47_10b]|nr:MAG: hypothetical protein A2666_02450 [Parcubacteria group bacterium RIFCSPHIGHO2_01_FULL_47_10b]
MALGDVAVEKALMRMGLLQPGGRQPVAGLEEEVPEIRKRITARARIGTAVHQHRFVLGLASSAAIALLGTIVTGFFIGLQASLWSILATFFGLTGVALGIAGFRNSPPYEGRLVKYLNEQTLEQIQGFNWVLPFVTEVIEPATNLKRTPMEIPPFLVPTIDADDGTPAGEVEIDAAMPFNPRFLWLYLFLDDPEKQFLFVIKETARHALEGMDYDQALAAKTELSRKIKEGFPLGQAAGVPLPVLGIDKHALLWGIGHDFRLNDVTGDEQARKAQQELTVANLKNRAVRRMAEGLNRAIALIRLDNPGISYESALQAAKLQFFDADKIKEQITTLNLPIKEIADAVVSAVKAMKGA